MAISCNNCYKELSKKEEGRYSLMRRFSGDMYCDKCLDKLEAKQSGVFKKNMRKVHGRR